MSDDTPPEGLEDRVEKLEAGQSTIIGKLDELLGGAHAKAAEHTETRLGRPTSVEEQVRAELARKDAEAKSAAEKEAQAADHETLAQRLARLEEKPPVQPQPRRQRIMWGAR